MNLFHNEKFDRTMMDRRDGVEVERLPRMREIGVRSPVETNPIRIKR